MPYRDRVSSPGPKKLLALDGGGIRGVITLEVLHRMESMLAEQLCAGDDFVLGDYFDYIAGTSTGAIIAAGLAHGLPVAHLLDLYLTRGLLDERLFSYVRYNVELSRGGLDDLGLPDLVPEEVQRLDSVAHINDLSRVGQAMAGDVAAEHFAGFLEGRP
jgi:hypothetical protein